MSYHSWQSFSSKPRIAVPTRTMRGFNLFKRLGSGPERGAVTFGHPLVDDGAPPADQLEPAEGNRTREATEFHPPEDCGDANAEFDRDALGAQNWVIHRKASALTCARYGFRPGWPCDLRTRDTG